MPVADLSHAFGIARRRRDAGARGADDRLEDEGRDILRAEPQNLVLKLLSADFSGGLGRGARPLKGPGYAAGRVAWVGTAREAPAAD